MPGITVAGPSSYVTGPVARLCRPTAVIVEPTTVMTASSRTLPAPSMARAALRVTCPGWDCAEGARMKLTDKDHARIVGDRRLVMARHDAISTSPAEPHRRSRPSSDYGLSKSALLKRPTRQTGGNLQRIGLLCFS